MRAADTSVLRETDAAVRKEVARLNLNDRSLNQATILTSLLVRNGCFQILNPRNAFPNEDDERHIANSADPGIANHLGIERQQSRRLFRVTAGRSFPVDETLGAVEFAEGIDISDEFIVTGKAAHHPHLQVLFRSVNLDPIVLCEALEQMDSLVNEAIPGFSFFVFEGNVAEHAPFLE